MGIDISSYVDKDGWFKNTRQIKKFLINEYGFVDETFAVACIGTNTKLFLAHKSELITTILGYNPTYIKPIDMIKSAAFMQLLVDLKGT